MYCDVARLILRKLVNNEADALFPVCDKLVNIVNNILWHSNLQVYLQGILNILLVLIKWCGNLQHFEMLVSAVIIKHAVLNCGRIFWMIMSGSLYNDIIVSCCTFTLVWTGWKTMQREGNRWSRNPSILAVTWNTLTWWRGWTMPCLIRWPTTPSSLCFLARLMPEGVLRLAACLSVHLCVWTPVCVRVRVRVWVRLWVGGWIVCVYGCMCVYVTSTLPEVSYFILIIPGGKFRTPCLCKTTASIRAALPLASVLLRVSCWVRHLQGDTGGKYPVQTYLRIIPSVLNEFFLADFLILYQIIWSVCKLEQNKSKSKNHAHNEMAAW